jgi:F0F1-type ATP synthase assembly protein I
MEKKSSPSPDSSNRMLLRYAGLGAQLLAAIGVSVFLGVKADEWWNTSPLMTLALPLLVLGGTFYKLIRETGNKKHDESK